MIYSEEDFLREKERLCRKYGCSSIFEVTAILKEKVAKMAKNQDSCLTSPLMSSKQ